MAKTLKRIDAGAVQVEALYDKRTARDTPVQRAAKQNASSEAQRRLNQTGSWQKWS